MKKQYYWQEVTENMEDATPHYNELLTEAEMKHDIVRYGMSIDDYQQTNVEVTERQTEMENLAQWFQRVDMNGEYAYCAREFRIPYNKPFGLTETECIDQFIAIAEEWKDNTDAEWIARIQSIIDRLEKLREEYKA